MAESILYQSVRDANGNPVQQLSNLCLTGLTTVTGQTQHDHGKFYAQFVQVDGSKTLSTTLENYDFTFSGGGTGYVLAIYADETRFSPVAVASSSTFGVTTITPLNNSGLGGTVNFLSYTADDTLIEIVALLSVDDDLPQDNLESFQEYSQTVGFAPYHEQAFEYICQFLKGREKATLWSPTYIDAKSINGGLGGYDLSRILNIQSQSLRDASSMYAYYKLCDKNTFDDQSIWAVRAKEARGLVRAHLEDTDLSFDMQNTRTESKNRSLTSWRIQRS